MARATGRWGLHRGRRLFRELGEKNDKRMGSGDLRESSAVVEPEELSLCMWEKIHRSLQVGCFLRATITDLKMGEDVRCSSLIKISSHIQGESSSGSMTGDDAHRSTLPILLSFFSQSSRKSRRARCNRQRTVE